MSAIDDLPPLRDVIKQHASVGAQIARAEFSARPQPHRAHRARGGAAGRRHHRRGRSGSRRIDARALLALGAKRVIAVERDERALAALEDISKRYPGRLEIVSGDATTFDPRPLLGGERAKIVANLPYNIATPLLIDWLSIEPWPPWYDMMVLMFQREVAERIVARENDEAYGRLAVLSNWRAETKSCSIFRRRRSCRSRRLRRRWFASCHGPAPEPCDRRALEQVAAAAFGQRRKMLRQSLKSLAADPARLAAAAHVDLTRRAETIPVSGFVAMARELIDIRHTKS